MKDLFEKSAFGGLVPVYADNGELMMLADEPAFAEFMAATFVAPKTSIVSLADKLAQQGVVAVYGDNGEHKANLKDPAHLTEYVKATGASHDSHHFEPQQAWQRKFSPDF